MLTLPAGLDLDLLRSFVMIVDCRSFARAAYRVGRTSATLTEQIHRLEEALGQQLLARHKRGIQLTPHGTWLVARTRPLLSLHDDILGAFRRPQLAGPVRLGVPDDYLQPWLPRILGTFSGAFPDVTVEAVAMPPDSLARQVREGRLDLALLCGVEAEEGGRPVWQGALSWIGAGRHAAHLRTPLPLALGPPGCRWRQAAIGALDSVCMPWRLACCCASASGGLPLVQAGLGVTVGVGLALPRGLQTLGPEQGLPRLPAITVRLLDGTGSARSVALGRHIEQVFEAYGAARLDGEETLPFEG